MDSGDEALEFYLKDLGQLKSRSNLSELTGKVEYLSPRTLD